MKTANERASELMNIKLKDLPLLAYKLMIAYAERYGGCGEVFYNSHLVYAQLEEKLEADNPADKATPEDLELFTRVKNNINVLQFKRKIKDE